MEENHQDLTPAALPPPLALRCAVVSEEGRQCPEPHLENSAYCQTHRHILNPKPGLKHNLYRRYMPAKLLPLYDEMFEDPEFFGVINEVAMHRTYLCDYLERCMNHKKIVGGQWVEKQLTDRIVRENIGGTEVPDPLPPDPKVLGLHSEMIRRLLESHKGRRYMLGVQGVGILIDSLVSMMVETFGDQPDKLRKILNKIKAIPLGPEETLDHDRPSWRALAMAKTHIKDPLDGL